MCKRSGVAQLPVLAENLLQPALLIRVHYVLCSKCSTLVHAHVKRSFEAEGKSTLRRIHLVRGDAEVGQYAISFLHSMSPQHSFQVPEILIDKNKTVIINCILFCI